MTKTNQDKEPKGTAKPILAVCGVTQRYEMDSGPVVALEELSLVFHERTTYALTGPSGSGKSTLLGLLAGLERVSSGSISFRGKNLTKLTEEELAGYRAQNVGFVFQSYQLIPALTALENIMLPAELRGDSRARGRATELLARVGLQGRAGHYPSQLSGGEQQRIALARAYINEPCVLLGDEPTGSLDAASAEIVEDLLFSLHRDHGTTVIVATHNLELARRFDAAFRLRAGKLDLRESRAEHPEESLTPQTDSPSVGGAGGNGRR